MKTNKILFGLLLVASTIVGCDYNKVASPPFKQDIQNADPTAEYKTIAELKAMYKGKATIVGGNIVIEAIISSDDSEGNFYKTITMQDSTGGIEVKLSMANLSTIYPQGSKVRLKCNSMVLGTYGGQVNIGYHSNNPKYETAFYPELLVPTILSRVEMTDFKPKVIKSFDEINPSMQATLIKLEGVEFSNKDLGDTFGDTTNAKKTVNRTLVDKAGKTLVVRTSAYARFASSKIPEGSGSVIGVLTYFLSTPQLIICRIQDVKLTYERF